MRRASQARSTGGVGDLSALRLRHQANDFFGHLWLPAFRVTLVETNDVGDDAAVAAADILELLRNTRTRLPPSTDETGWSKTAMTTGGSSAMPTNFPAVAMPVAAASQSIRFRSGVRWKAWRASAVTAMPAVKYGSSFK